MKPNSVIVVSVTASVDDAVKGRLALVKSMST